MEKEEYEENVGVLAKLIIEKTHHSAPEVQQLLDETRVQRNKWLQEEISITTILDKYPCFKHSKWVSVLEPLYKYRPITRHGLHKIKVDSINTPLPPHVLNIMFLGST